ncbi:UPF0231 family protein [Thalassotalea ganghwensis]
MEYEFRRDVVTGNATVNFSDDHRAFGVWFEIELGADLNRIAKLIETVNQVIDGSSSEQKFIGSEYSLVINRDDVLVYANALHNGLTLLPEHLLEQQLALDSDGEASCGPEDFLELLTSWQSFIA